MAKVLVGGEQVEAGCVLIPNEALDRLREKGGHRFVEALALLSRLCELEGGATVKRQPHRIPLDGGTFCSDFGPKNAKRALEVLAECEIVVYEQHGEEFVVGWVLEFDDWPVPID